MASRWSIRLHRAISTHIAGPCRAELTGKYVEVEQRPCPRFISI